MSATSPASSTNRHHPFTSRICSTVRQRDFQEPRTGDENRQALRARDGDVQPVAAEEERQIARHVLAARGRQREEHDRRLAALKLVDRPGFDARGQMLEKQRTCMLYGATTRMSLGSSGCADAIAIDIASISKEAM